MRHYARLQKSVNTPHLTKTYLDGAVFWDEQNPVIVYTARHNRLDNFWWTVAHEIGHIVLEHLLIPRSLKTGIELFIEEHEANEFAGRLLMPEKMLCSCNYYSIDSVAQYFIVSRSALWKRLNNMKRLDLLNSRKIQACSRCGNTDEENGSIV